MSNNESAENLTQEANGSDSAKISMAESIVIVTISAMGDFADIIGVFFLAIPFIGIIVYFLAKTFSWFTWFIVLFWAGLRNSNGGVSVGKKILTLIGGKATDELLAGILPLQTASVIATIYLNNATNNSLLGKSLSVLKHLK